MYKIPISVASIQINLTSPLSAEKLRLMERYATFMRQEPSPRYTIEMTWEEYREPLSALPEPIYDPGDIWKLYRSQEEYLALISYFSFPNRLEETDHLYASRTWDKIRLVERRTGPNWVSLLNVGAGELVVRTAILFIQGLVFHASGLDDNGKGIVFIGHSGAGKSTQLQIWEKESGVIAMNDDRIPIIADDKEIRCFGTPWGGSADIANNHSAPLKAILLLQQAPENSIQLLDKMKVSSWLMARAFLPYFDKTLMTLAMQNLSRIIERVPIYLLRCRPEREVIELVRSVL